MAFPWEALLNGGATLASALLGARAINKATTAEQKAATNTAGAITASADQTRADLEPWRKAGVNALGWLENANIPGQMTGDQIAEHVKSLPGYRFAEEELDKNIDRRHAASGNRFSGRGFKEMTRWKNKYLLEPAFQNWLGQMGQIAGYGPAATQNAGTVGMNAAINAGGQNVLAAQNAGQNALGQTGLYTDALQSIMRDVFASMR